ncbi:MAG: type IX secretion system outer membrane channel protein PorV [Bacteroidia bacterium]|nr:type IX secretion system outer membrane channel protein PorV [Bacteroidia bacterium]
MIQIQQIMGGNRFIKFYIILFLPLFSIGQSANSTTGNQQTLNTIITAVPFLTINNDIVSLGKGGLGTATSSFYQGAGFAGNPALLATGRKNIYGQFTYLPWLRALVPDINYSSGNFAFAFHKRHTIGVEFVYFSMGPITFTDNTGNNIGQYKPNEFATTLNYAVSLGRTFKLGLGLRYINSNLTGGYFNGGTGSVGRAFSTNWGFLYRDTVQLYSTGKLQWGIGLCLQDIGTKISYSSTKIQKDFLPQNLRIGCGITFRQKAGNNSYFAFDLGYEVNKLLVPTPPVYATNANGQILEDANGNKIIAKGKNPNVSSLAALFTSFADAPYGSKEEWAEVNHIVGFETRHVLNNRIYWALRTGYFYESKWKGGRQYTTIGGGFGLWGAGINLFYLIPNTSQRSPLENTLGFQLSYSINLGKGTGFFKD